MSGIIPSHATTERRSPHSCSATRGMPCDGCPMLSCIRAKSRLAPWRFWCDGRHRTVDPSVGCDRRPEPADEKPTFAELLVSAMRREGLTKADVARATGTRANTVGQWTSGRAKPSRENAEKLAELLNIECDARVTGWKLHERNMTAGGGGHDQR